MNGVQFLLVILAALAVSSFATKRGLRSGVVVVLVGTAVSFVPGMPRLTFSSDLILGTIMPPLLFSAARDFPLSYFVRHSRSIFGLGVILVVATTVVIGAVTYWLLPAITLGGAFVLAAVVSPPDTITTVVHGREFGLTNRCVSILTGESIVNDAAALTLFTAATLAVTRSHAFIGNPLLLFGYAAIVGILVGFALGHLAVWIRERLNNPSYETVVGVILPFCAYLAADEIHASGVLAVVMAGFILAVHSILNIDSSVSPATRIQESAIWPGIDALLEAVVFAYIGLQAKYVLESLRHESISADQILGTTAVILLLLTGIRMLFVFYLFSRQRERLPIVRRDRRSGRHRGETIEDRPVSGKEAFLIGWTGMRGIVTIGAAASIPLTTAAGGKFPARIEIQTIAYLVAFATLVVQSSLLPVFARRFDLDLAADARDEFADIRKALAAADSARVHGVIHDHPWFESQRVAVAKAVQGNEVTDHAARIVIQRLDHAELALSRRERLFADEGDMPESNRGQK